jgi:NAD(P)-dependent dehydrogenase (short-subunit alcohol dehydrogenase family)
MRDLADRAVLITGAASGIGRAAALAFAREGSDPILLNDIDEAGLADVTREVELLGRTAVALPADVSDAAAVRKMVEAALAACGRIDVLVNSAGVVSFCPIEQLTLADWKSVLDVDLEGVINTVGAVYPHMLTRGQGHIVNVASSSGLFDPVLYLAPYVTAKFAVVGLSEALMLEARVHGVGVSCVCPGSTDTPIWDGIAIKGFSDGARKMMSVGYSITTTADYAARLIVNSVKKDRFLVVTTWSAKTMYFIRRHAPAAWFGFMKRFAPLFAFVFKRYRA